jgi:Protein of unknown function (DUF3175)
MFCAWKQPVLVACDGSGSGWQATHCPRTRQGSISMAKKPGTAVTRRWSGKVTRESDALDLEEGVFTWDDPQRIAASLKRSADASRRRKAPPFRSAMSMLVFYINRAGKNLDRNRLRILEQAREELRRLYGREGRRR